MIDRERFFQMVVGALPGPVSYVNREFRYLFANQAYDEWFGVTPAQCLRLSMTDVVGEVGMQTLRPYLDAALAGEEQTFEAHVRYKKGGHRTVRCRYVPDRERPDGPVVGLVIIVNDVTSERLREVASQLDESRRELRLILDSSQHGIWGLNTRGEVTFINRRAVELLGYANAEELIGQPMHDTVHYRYADGRAHPKEFCPMYDSFRNRNTHHVVDDVLWRKDGTSFPISYYSTPVLIGDRCTGSVVTFEDITVQKTLEASLEVERLKSLRSAKLASLGEMSAGIAHEINNPLAILSGTVGLLASVVDQPEKLAAKLETMRKSCARIARIVKGLQKFSRSGDKPNLQIHGLARIVQEALVLTEIKANRHRTPITVEGRTSASILCDDVEIEQVFINLINNAVDAVKTRIQRWVRIVFVEEDETVGLRIVDAGPGIPVESRHRLFEPFFTTKDVGQGTGLGLSISKGILDEHRATIAVLSEEPRTTFEIKFPKVAGAARVPPPG